MRRINFELGPSCGSEKGSVDGRDSSKNLDRGHSFIHPLSSIIASLTRCSAFAACAAFFSRLRNKSFGPQYASEQSLATYKVFNRKGTIDQARDQSIADDSDNNLYRSIAILAPSPVRPSVPSQSTTTLATTSEKPAPSSFSPLSQPSFQQIRGAKRDTYNPSHVVRKRRHGYLSRIKTRTGRMILKRRRMKKRSTLSH